MESHFPGFNLDPRKGSHGEFKAAGVGPCLCPLWDLGAWLQLLFQPLRHVWLFVTLDCSTPDFPVLHHLPGFTQIHGYS